MCLLRYAVDDQLILLSESVLHLGNTALENNVIRIVHVRNAVGDNVGALVAHVQTVVSTGDGAVLEVQLQILSALQLCPHAALCAVDGAVLDLTDGGTLSDDAVLADALSTALFVMGYDAAMLCHGSGVFDFEAVFFLDDGTVTATGGAFYSP